MPRSTQLADTKKSRRPASRVTLKDAEASILANVQALKEHSEEVEKENQLLRAMISMLRRGFTLKQITERLEPIADKRRIRYFLYDARGKRAGVSPLR